MAVIDRWLCAKCVLPNEIYKEGFTIDKAIRADHCQLLLIEMAYRGKSHRFRKNHGDKRINCHYRSKICMDYILPCAVKKRLNLGF